jgi:hypothetical protein
MKLRFREAADWREPCAGKGWALGIQQALQAERVGLSA